MKLSGNECVMSQESIEQIIELLASTEMTISEIAECMFCSRSAVLSINRRFQVRRLIIHPRIANTNAERNVGYSESTTGKG